jgi:acid phosphatase
VRRLTALLAVVLAAAVTAVAATAGDGKGSDRLSRINHIVVIYEENHSFDNLYGGWEGVNGLSSADLAHTQQVDQAGLPYGCLLQDDVNLVTALGACGFANTWFTIDNYIHPADTTCPLPVKAFSFPNGVLNGNGQGLPGGCTRDIVHRFYQEQYQLHGGQQNRYVTGSDAVGLVMGVYDTKALPIYAYLHQDGHPHYAIEDSFFQGAFGGSFLNHQWLVAAASPTYNGIVPAGLNAVLDANGFPNKNYPLYTPTGTVNDGALTSACPAPLGLACGNFAVNTMQPQTNTPSSTFGAKLPTLTSGNIGDELSAAHVEWAWYSGGWDDTTGNTSGLGYTGGPGPSCANPNHDPAQSHYPVCPDNLFQYHHQPFVYFQGYGVGGAQRSHLQDEADFVQAAGSSGKSCNLKPVSFVKPLGEENEHPGYASEPNGSNHLVSLLQAIEGSKCAKDTLVVVTYDEFGGQWDHVPPPGQAGGPAGPHDEWGPGTRVPTLVISPFLRGDFVVDSAEHDTTSILATIERRFGVAALGTRDGDPTAHDLSTVFDAKSPFDDGD